jgi:hypothetical protein
MSFTIRPVGRTKMRADFQSKNDLDQKNAGAAVR